MSKRVSNIPVDAEFIPGPLIVATLAEIRADETRNKSRTVQPSAKDIRRLADSIKANGLIYPLIVEDAPENEEGIKFDLDAGFQRFRALKVLAEEDGIEVPVEVKYKKEGANQEDLNLAENVDRFELTYIDLGNAAKRHIEAGGTATDFAKKIHKTPAFVHYVKKFTDLRPVIQKRINDGTLPFGLAQQLVGMKTDEAQDKAIERFDAGQTVKAAGAGGKGPRKDKRGRKKLADETTEKKGISAKRALLEMEERVQMLKASEKPSKTETAAMELYKGYAKYLGGRMGVQALDKLVMSLV